MVNFLDLILLAFLVYFVIIGARKGFVRTLLSFVTRIASVVVAWLVSDNYAHVLYDKFLKDNVADAIELHIKSADAGTVAQSFESALQGIPVSLVNIAESFGLNLQSLKYNFESADITGELASALEETVAGPIALVVCKIVIFAVVCVVASLVLNIVVNIVCKIVKLPVLRTANKLLGAVLGVLNGLIAMFILSFLCIILSGFIDNDEFTTLVSSSYIIEYFKHIRIFI